jgi:nitric-oxide synthase, brain
MFYLTLKEILNANQDSNGTKSLCKPFYKLMFQDENRYHEDIFGITLRTAEVHSKSRESARMRMASQP